MANEALLMLPEIILLGGALLIPLLGGAPNNRARSTMAFTALLMAFGLVAWMAIGYVSDSFVGFFDQYPELANMVTLNAFEVTPFALFFKLTFLSVALLVVASSRDYLQDRRESAEYYALLLMATLGMMVVASSRDLLTLFVGLETSALSSYTLAGYRRRSMGPAEASTKFFIIGALSAALTLYGISLIYALAGTVDIYQLATIAGAEPGSRPALLLAAAFLIAGFGFKLTSVPFHMWAPDVYQGAPDTISAFLSGASKKMGFAAFFKVFFIALVAAKLQWGPIVGLLAVVTMIWGNLAALQQTSMKRLLAWSSVAQAGYIMIAIPVGTPEALAGGLFHIFTHALMKGGAFLLVGFLAVRGIPDDMANYRGLGKRQPLAAFTLVILLLSMAGIPPLAGFWSKFTLFKAAVDAGVAQDQWGFLALAIAGITGSAISVVYYARVAWVIYVQPSDGSPQPLSYAGAAAGVTMLVLLLVILVSLLPGPFLDFSRVAANDLMASVPQMAPPIVPIGA